MVEMGEELLRVEDVYKIFGPQPRGRAFELSQGGMGKGDVHARTGHVVGLRDVNFDVKRGEIFVIMGLSGSGKSTAIRTVNKLLDTTNGQVMVDGIDVQNLDGTDLQEFRRAAIPIWYNWANKNEDAKAIFDMQLEYMMNDTVGYVTEEDLKAAGK